MNQITSAQKDAGDSSPRLGLLDAPKIQLLGSLDDEQGLRSTALTGQTPLEAIIYSGS